MALVVIKPGPLLTIQDLGRPGWGRFGISPSGAMDPLAARAANALAGNPAGAPLLELTGAGAVLRFEAARLAAVAGADLGAAIASLSAAIVDAGATLHFSARRHGARAYLAVAGGLRVARTFDSAAADLGGGLGGRSLAAGDRLELADVPTTPATAPRDLGALGACYDDPHRLRFVAAADA